MQNMDECYRHERLGLRFLRSLRAGEPEELAELWRQAETDPTMEAMFEELLKAECATADALDQSVQKTTNRHLPLRKELASPTPRDRRPLPPLATVIVRHQPSVVENTSKSLGSQSSKEPRSNAGFIEKA
jgi:hypothetical protein